MSLLVDTGVYVSAADADEPRHAETAGILVDNRGRLFSPATVIAETAWLIEHRLGAAAEARFLAMAIDEVRIVELTRGDYQRCIELIDRYADMGLGLVDASIVAIGERLGVTRIATLNERDFRVVRPAHCDAFVLVP